MCTHTYVFHAKQWKVGNHVYFPCATFTIKLLGYLESLAHQTTEEMLGIDIYFFCI